MNEDDLCDHCGGSGVLNILDWKHDLPNAIWVEDEPFASSCHACENGLLWKEVLE